MARIPKRQGEDMSGYMRRATKTARKMYRALGHTSMAEQALSRVHRTAEQLYPLNQPIDLDRPTPAKDWVSMTMQTLPETDWRAQQGIHRVLEEEMGMPFNKRARHNEPDGSWMHRTGWRKRKV